MRLTALQIEQLPIPEKGQKTHWDGDGFGVRVSQGGSKSFVVMYGTDRRLKTLGKYPLMSLKQARKAALEVRLTDTPQTRLDSFTDARRAFIQDCETRLRPSTVSQYEFYLQKTEEERLSKVSKKTLTDHTPHCIASWKAFFNWCIREELVSKNPFAFAQVKYNSRSRVLNDDEVRAIWNYNFPPYSDYLKLQFLTGQRIGQWKAYSINCNDNVITFPASVMKGKVEHSIPLSAQVQNLLPVLAFNGWSKAKARLDKHVPLPHWTIHDIRRSFATRHAELGTPIHVVEAILAHSGGQVSGVHAIYNRYNYLKEMQTALDNWEKMLISIVTRPS